VRAGFIVRTRADAELREARARTTTRRDCALASGAQCVSTDFPVPDRRYSDYEVRLPGGASARLNPVNTAPTPAAAFATPN
ncbi:MAG TPA: Ca2+-dependent phosphoinositide-specific phospholipase C, partial [Opitutaceae bacterium]|nr:Ca2+-dependent phosphoinositide-specific phospholipase C [Opitutaceae bacterium]